MQNHYFIKEQNFVKHDGRVSTARYIRPCVAAPFPINSHSGPNASEKTTISTDMWTVTWHTYHQSLANPLSHPIMIGEVCD